MSRLITIVVGDNCLSFIKVMPPLPLPPQILSQPPQVPNPTNAANSFKFARKEKGKSQNAY